MITQFEGSENFYLSNFFSCDVNIAGIVFPTSEHAFMYFKTLDKAEADEIAAAGSPSEAKRLGRQCTLRPDWEQIKVAAMSIAVLSKFTQNPELMKRLKATGDQHIIEGNWWHDNIWGDCMCDRCEGITGRNLLGQILMETRKV